MAHAKNVLDNAARHYNIWYQVKDLMESTLQRDTLDALGNDYEDWGADCSSYQVWAEKPAQYVADEGHEPGVPLTNARRADYKAAGFAFKQDGTVTFEGKPVEQWLKELAPKPAPKPAAAKPATKRRANTPKQKSENFMADHGIHFEDLTTDSAIHYRVTTPFAVAFNASDCHSIVVNFPRSDGHKQVGWTRLWDQLRHGVRECTEPNCGMCERGNANV